MRRIVKLPPCVNDVPGGTSCVQLPRYPAVLLQLYIVGRAAEEVSRIVIRVNGVPVVEFGPWVDDDGAQRTGGELAMTLQALRGFAPGKLVMPVRGIDVWAAHCVTVEIALVPGAEQGRTQLFAKLDR